MANDVGGDTYDAALGTFSVGARCGCICCCSGELSGDPLDRDDRSDEPDVTDCR